MAKLCCGSSVARAVCMVVAVSLLLCCDKVKGQYYTGPCSSSQVGSVQEVYKNSEPVPKAGAPGSLCTVSVAPLPLDQKFVSTCTTLCCSDPNNCQCGATRAAYVSCSGAVASTIYCWIAASSPVFVYNRSACCANFHMNPSTGICEAAATTTMSLLPRVTTQITTERRITSPSTTTTVTTTTTTISTTAEQSTTTPLIVLLLTESSGPVSNNARQTDSGVQGPLLYGVIGAIIFLALAILLAAVIFFCCRRRRRQVDDFSGLEARVRVAPVAKKADKVKAKEGKAADDVGKGKAKVEPADGRNKSSTSSQRELFYDIDDLSGEVFAVEGPLTVTDDDLAVTFAPAPHEPLGRAVSNDYVTLPAPSAQIPAQSSQGEGQDQGFVDADPVYQSIL